MWSDLRADSRFYAALRHPDGCGALRRWMSCSVSRGFLTLAVQRLSRFYNDRRRQSGWTPQTLALKPLVMLGKILVVILTKSDIAETSIIHGGVYLSDLGYLTIGPQRVGRGTIIHHRVTIGVQAGGGKVKPVIGENVWIGPDSVIFGDTTIGDGATILPGTVLSMSVPPRAVACGNPATILAREFDNAVLRRSLASDVDRALLPKPCTRSGK